METLYQILAIMAGGMLVWFIYRGIKGNPQAFSKANLNKSFFTMGLLGVALIVFVAVLALFLRST